MMSVSKSSSKYSTNFTVVSAVNLYVKITNVIICDTSFKSM